MSFDQEFNEAWEEFERENEFLPVPLKDREEILDIFRKENEEEVAFWKWILRRNRKDVEIREACNQIIDGLL